MSVARLLIPAYVQHSALYSIWIFLWMDRSAADSAMSCKQFSNPDDGCFLLSRENRTWEESKTFCNGLGDGWSLVEIEDVETQTHVDCVSRTAGVSTGSWIGLRWQNGFTWVSGKKLGFQGYFKRLAAGEVQAPGDCLITQPPGDTSIDAYGTWNYMNCSTRLYSICHAASSSLTERTTTTSRRTITSTMTPTTTPANSQLFTAAIRRSTAPTQSTTARTQSTTTRTATSVTSSSIETTALSTLESSTSMMSSDTIAMISTKPTVMPTTPMPVVIAVSSGATGGAVVVLAGVVIVLCQRNKQKRLRVRTNDDTESGTVTDVRTKPEVEYAVVTKIQRKQPSQVHDCNTESGYHYASVDDGALPMKQDVNDQTYDTATITEKKQPITFDNTYARAIFSQSSADTVDDVYDHTRVTGKASHEVDASHYDHAFFK
ncbi:uncharacterized protein [Haliotis cracherodii]|uniref:uncharacterized protein n=1 Tax=Haliotis cracherodii TaxID=6455 RepID=UPI0039E76DF7